MSDLRIDNSDLDYLHIHVHMAPLVAFEAGGEVCDLNYVCDQSFMVSLLVNKREILLGNRPPEVING